jgi:hypothetical protein
MSKLLYIAISGKQKNKNMEHKHDWYFEHCPLSQAKRSQTFQRLDLSPASDGKADTQNLLQCAMYIETIIFLKIKHHHQNASKVGGMILIKETNLPCRYTYFIWCLHINLF